MDNTAGLCLRSLHRSFVGFITAQFTVKQVLISHFTQSIQTTCSSFGRLKIVFIINTMYKNNIYNKNIMKRNIATENKLLTVFYRNCLDTVIFLNFWTDRS